MFELPTPRLNQFKRWNVPTPIFSPKKMEYTEITEYFAVAGRFFSGGGSAKNARTTQRSLHDWCGSGSTEKLPESHPLTLIDALKLTHVGHLRSSGIG